MNEKCGALCLQGPGGVVKTIHLLTILASWEGQMVSSQQVITANMLLRLNPHKWVIRATWNIWDFKHFLIPSLWAFL